MAKEAMYKRVGLKEIAQEVGVDVSTVSRALRDDPRVKTETTQVVRRKAHELGYRPNRLARALRGGKTDRVAVLLSPPQVRFASPIFLELLATLDQLLRARSMTLAVFAAHRRDEERDIVRSIVEDRLADAVVIGRTQESDARVRYLLEAGFPFVTFGRTDWPDRHPWVDIDYAKAGRLAIEALMQGKPARISILAAPRGLRFADGYVAGARAAASELGAPDPDAWRIEMTEAAGEELAPGLFRDGPRHAIACIQDSLAFGLYRAAAREGRVIGHDISVFGGQNFPGSEHTAPPLSTFSTEDRTVAERLSEVVIARLGQTSDGPFENEVLHPAPLLRKSHLLD
ncbi:MAG: LacI family transcriptional regulator [Boseongicola sp. SB0664_bin_43]|uniref:LacI family transcriptional regulator n=1 Tax=Boseongicola sp. SB0664_bin_43 TaxID=2604844 RepID=A0A6B0XVL5_9RHOB|nr:LacI family transcriptional regulator [Boseongicola sp. SB0664_bin_43]MYK30990.1 LacI family transcriptional regulator [Boseongicola sp. SB0670_bin_30]